MGYYNGRELITVYFVRDLIYTLLQTIREYLHVNIPRFYNFTFLHEQGKKANWVK